MQIETPMVFCDLAEPAGFSSAAKRIPLTRIAVTPEAAASLR